MAGAEVARGKVGGREGREVKRGCLGQIAWAWGGRLRGNGLLSPERWLSGEFRVEEGPI